MDMGDESHEPDTGTELGLPTYHAYDDVNISEEVKKTGIWHHLNSQPTLATSSPAAASASADVSHPRHRSVNFRLNHAVV